MLDTNTLDYIYFNKIQLVPKLKDFSNKHINLYITHIQQDEINNIKDISKKDCITKIISIIKIKRVLAVSTIIDIDKQSKHRLIRPMDIYKLVDESDLHILKKLRKQPFSNYMGKKADLIILYAAIKKKMDYLITDNTYDFEPILKEMSKFMPNYLQVKKNYYLNYF
jgi:hypothetical protein